MAKSQQYEERGSNVEVVGWPHGCLPLVDTYRHCDTPPTLNLVSAETRAVYTKTILIRSGKLHNHQLNKVVLTLGGRSGVFPSNVRFKKKEENHLL